MSSPDDIAAAMARRPVLHPYKRDREESATVLRTVAFITLVAFACFVYGFAFALFFPGLLVVIAAPVAILAALVIWSLPGARTAPTGTLQVLFFAFTIGTVLWPNYLALAFPGLPWITVARLTGAPMALILLICLSISGTFRNQMGAILSVAPLVWKLLAAFVAIALFSIVISGNKGVSVDKFITSQISWTAMFFAGCYVFSRPGQVQRWAALLWAMALGEALLGLWEFKLRHIVWAYNIPSFLAVQDPAVAKILDPGHATRAFTNIYRVQGTFAGSIALAEYNSLVFPFLFNFAIQPYRRLIRVLAAASVPLVLFASYLTNARSGMLGFLIATMLYALYWAVTRWRRDPKSLLGPLITLVYPALGVVVLGATFFVGRLHRLILGSGAQASSTAARLEQTRMGIPKILHNPIGYGIGRGGDVLGYISPDGNLTVDNYYLVVALEYGVIGFLIYFGMFLFAIYAAGRYTFLYPGDDKELSFLAPAGIALANFVVVKSVFSQQDNHALVFMILGMVVALIYRLRTKAGWAPTPARGRSAMPRPQPAPAGA